MSLKDTKKSPVPKPNVVLVLQGGGALGAYHIGAYQALEEAGFRPRKPVFGLIGFRAFRSAPSTPPFWSAMSRSDV